MAARRLAVAVFPTPFGPTIAKVEIGRFARTLGTLLASAVPLINAVRIVQEVVTSDIISEGISKIADGAKRGLGVARPMREAGVFPPLATHLVEVGEETGRLDAMLLQLADIYNLLNNNVTLAFNPTFIPNEPGWQSPSTYMNPRVFRLNAEYAW